MIEKLDINSGNVLGFRASGTLTEDDYRDVLVPALDRAIQEYGVIRVLLKIEDFEGWTPGAAWEDFKQAPKIRNIDRMAIIGEENWEKWMTDLVKFFASFTKTDIRFFREGQVREALDWVRGWTVEEVTAPSR